MHRLPRYNLVGKEEKKDNRSKQVGVFSSSSLLGEDSGKNTKDIVSGNGCIDYSNGRRYADEEGGENNPWVSASSVSTATLRTRHYGPKWSNGFAYPHHGDADTWSFTGSNHRYRNPQQETRRRRRSRSATASTSKHPLYVDGDGDVDPKERSHYHSHSETQPHYLFSSIDDHQTRPSLRRAVGSLERCANEDTSRVIRGDEEPAAPKVDVIVHKVMRTDTLAGISLKYNIPLAKLRKANKLWANDSIHLRSTLYIPLRDISSPSSLSKTLPCKSNSISPLLEHHKIPSEFELGTDNNTSPDASSSPAYTQDELQKVPLSQLSFFPPSRAANTPTTIPTSHFTFSNDTQLTLSSTRSGTNTSPAFSLNSLIQGLNNATQEIKSRISFDSYSSNHSSDHGEDGEIELDTVKPSRKRSRLERGIGGGSDIHYPSLSSFSQDAPRTPIVNSQRSGRNIGETSSTVISPSLPSPSTPKKAIIRTVQLQPSPEMKIPTSTSQGWRTSQVTTHYDQELPEPEIDSDAP